MKRYFTYKPKMEWDDDYPMLLHGLTVFDRDDEPYDTGLIDKRGNSIMAANYMDPIGYVRRS